jgi:hypothetical protein
MKIQLKSWKSWTFCASFFWVASLGALAHAEDRCVLRFNRDEVDVVRGEIRIDLNRRIQRECRGLNAGNVRLDQVTVELRDDRRDSRYDGRDRDRYDDRDRGRRYGRGETIPIYRFYDGKRHRMSDNPDDSERYGNNEGVMFELYRDGGRNRKALYACSTARGDNFLSLQSNCEGHSVLAQLGYIAQSPEGQDTQPVYRCFNGKLGDHIATKDQNECAASRYSVELTLGYTR